MAAESGARHNREVLERLMVVIRSDDLSELDELLHPDFVQEIPQSGERVRGIEAFRKILQNFPEGGPINVAPDPYIAGRGEHYVMTPTFNVVRVEDEGDEMTSYVKARYPDGSDWYVVTFTSFKEGKVVKRVDFFGPCFDPPEWRSQWTERM